MAVGVLAISIPELPELLARLKKIGDKKLANKAFRKGLRTGTKRMAKEAKANAPVHDGPYPESRKDREPGTYKNSIKVRAIKRTRKGVGMRVADFRRDGAYYGAFGELGTKHQKANPVLRAAFDGNRDQAVLDLKEEIKTAVEKAFKK
jgi:HK97 gp10 family phage protein